MYISKRVLVAGLLSCVVTQSLNAIRYSRPVSLVSSSVVAEIITAMNSNKPKLVLKHLRDNGLSINSQLTDQHETALHLVAQLGKQETAEQLLAQGGSGARVNVRDRKGKTPLAYARDNGHTDLAELLQTYTQAELAVLQNTTKRQDLFVAAADNDRAGVERLLAEGADVRERKKHGPTAYMQLGFKTPFHIAFEAEHYSLAAFLLREAQGINGLDEQGWTPLMLAIMADDWDMVRELIKDGADVFAGYRRRSSIQNALAVAQIQNALAVAQMMKSEAQLVDIFVDERGVEGVVHTYGETWPFIMLASERGYTEVVKLLLEQGAELDSEEMMRLAMLRNNWQMILTLIEDEAKLIDVFIAAKGVDGTIETSGDTLLILAARGGHTKAVELLIANNADLHIRSKYNETALTEAAGKGHTETTALLLDAFLGTVRKLVNDGADIFAHHLQACRTVRLTNSEAQLVDIFAEGGVRSVYKALERANQEFSGRYERRINSEFLNLMRKKLVAMLQPKNEKTTEPMVQDLLQAVANNDRANVERLLANGAHPQEKNVAGETALDIAISTNQRALAAILLRAAEGVNGSDGGGWTPLSWAVISGDENLVQDLLKDGANPNELSRDAIEMAMLVKKKEILELVVGMGTEDIFTFFRRALQTSVYDGDLQQLKMLLETGVDPSVATPRDESSRIYGDNFHYGTLLHMAAGASWQSAKADDVKGGKIGGDRKAIMEYLLADTAIDINALDGDKRTALQVLVSGYDNDSGSSVFDILMARHAKLVAAGEKGIDLNHRDSHGKTALDIAVDSYRVKQHFATNLSRAVADLKVSNQ